MASTRPAYFVAAACLLALTAISCSTTTDGNAVAGDERDTRQSQSKAASPAVGGGLFGGSQPWNVDVSSAEPSERSDAIIAALADAGGWGNDNVLQIDFGIPIWSADSSTPRMKVVGAEDYCFGGAPDCDDVPTGMPVPEDAHIEASDGLTCDTANEDCHFIVVDRDERKLYEIYHATSEGGDLSAEGLFVWNLDEEYPETLRGDQCTSADAAGLPIAALTPTADEVAAGAIDHPLRFILPNDRMKADVFVRPATHAGGPESTDENAPPYGVRFRLRPDFDDSGYNADEKVVIAALKKYGMVLSDGGNIALTFADDANNTAKWEDLEIDSKSFADIAVDQFEVADLGEEIALTYDCVRN